MCRSEHTRQCTESARENFPELTHKGDDPAGRRARERPRLNQPGGHWETGPATRVTRRRRPGYAPSGGEAAAANAEIPCTAREAASRNPSSAARSPSDTG